MTTPVEDGVTTDVSVVSKDALELGLDADDDDIERPALKLAVAKDETIAVVLIRDDSDVTGLLLNKSERDAEGAFVIVDTALGVITLLTLLVDDDIPFVLLGTALTDSSPVT